MNASTSSFNQIMPPPAGAAWVGQPDSDGARFYSFPAAEVDNIAARVVGVQDVDGSTASSVGVAVSGPAADLTPAQARQVARLLMNLADRAEDTWVFCVRETHRSGASRWSPVKGVIPAVTRSGSSA